MKEQNAVRDIIEKIHTDLQTELVNVALAIKMHNAEDGFTDFDMLRILESLENAIEVYGEVLGYITYDD